MKKSSTDLPAVIPQRSDADADSNSNPTDLLWKKLTTFLSLRAPNTATTYLSIIKEWCLFLGAEAGTPTASNLFLSATDDQAAAYRRWLSNRPGEIPRSKRTKKSPIKNIPITPNTPPSTAALQRGSSSKRQRSDGHQTTLSNATIAKKFAALRRIYRMILSADLGPIELKIRHNPFDTDRTPPPPKDSGRKRPTEMVDFALVKKILTTPDASTPKGLRDQAILAVLFGGGLRRSEVVNLTLADIKRSPKGTVFLRLRATKSKKDYDQALPNWAADPLLRLLTHRQSDGAPMSAFLFVSYRGKAGIIPTSERLSDNGLYRLFKHYCEKAGATQFLTPHSARATAITKLLADGIPHREVQEFSRHSSIQMVELYDKRRLIVEENLDEGIGV